MEQSKNLTTNQLTKAKAQSGGSMRPTDYKPEHCQRVIELGKAGKSVTQMASALDVHKDTVYEWAKKHAEFSDALSRARQESQTWWEDQGQIGLTADRFQPSLWAKQVSCRFPDDYREKQDVNIGGQKDNPLALILRDIDGSSSGLPEDKG